MRARPWLASVLLPSVLCLVVHGIAAARPNYAAMVDDAAQARARDKFTVSAERDGVEAGLVKHWLTSNVVAVTYDTGCPDIDIDVVNGTDHTVWSVELKIEQKEGATAHDDVIHLPYVPAASVVHTRVPCLGGNYARYGGSIQLGYIAHGTPSLAAALSEMRAGVADYAFGDNLVTPASGLTRSLLAVALASEDAEVALELVAGIARTAVGIDELVAEITDHPDGPLAREVAHALPSAAPAAQLVLARAALATADPSPALPQLQALIDGPLCRGKRDAAVQLWVQAQSERTMPAAGLRDRVRARCKLAAGDTAALATALDGVPASAGPTVDALDDAAFDKLLAEWKRRPALPAALVGYARDTDNAERFDRAADRAVEAASSPVAAITELAAAPPGPISAHKAAWITARIDKLPRDAVVAALTEALVQGKITAPAMREALRAVRANNPGAQLVVSRYANAEWAAFDVHHLAAGIDAAELLALSYAKLRACGPELARLRSCLAAIAAYQDGALTRPNAAPLTPGFTRQLQTVVDAITDPHAAAEIGAELRKVGLPNLAVEKWCQLARMSSVPSALDDVRQVDPEAPCLTEIADRDAGRRHKDIWLGVFGLLGLVAPIGVGGVAIRRRHHKLSRDLPPAVEATPPERLSERLGANGLGRGLRAGIAAARRELEGAPFAPSLAAIDSAVLDAAAQTVDRAVRSGDAATLLVRRPDSAIYLVALPVRDPRPQLVQRYLGASWPDHAAAIQRAAAAPLVSLILACGPDASEASLVIGFTPGTGAPSDPEALLDARLARARGANAFRHVMPLTASPTLEA